MQKPISRMQHGIADWLLVPALVALPYLAGFANEGNPRNLAWICSVTVLLATACTRAEWGVFRIMPYRIHLMLDASLGVMLLTSPYVLGFTAVPIARNIFMVLGVLLVVASTLLSRPEEMPGNAAAAGPSLES